MRWSLPSPIMARMIGKPVDTVFLKGPDGYEKALTRSVDTLLPSGNTGTLPTDWPDHLHGLYKIRSCVSGGGLMRTVRNSATLNIKESHVRSASRLRSV